MTSTMRRMMGMLFLLSSAGTGLAAAPVITGSGATGSPGGPAVVEVVVDFGTDFQMASQDIRFQYDPSRLNFVADDSVVHLGGTPMTWAAYLTHLLGSGLVIQNFNDAFVEVGQKGYALSFAGAIARSGPMQLSLSFDILPGAAPGPTQVTFKGSTLANAVEEEFYFPDSLVSPGLAVTVTAVPEPSQAILLLAGVGLLAAWRLRAKS